MMPGTRARAVTALGVAQTLAWASSYYLPAVLAEPMSIDLGVQPSTVFAAFSVALLAAAALSPIAGRSIDRWEGRPVLMSANVVGLLRRFHPLLSARLATLLHPLGVVVLAVAGAPAAAVFVLMHGLGNGILTIAIGTLPLMMFGSAGYGRRQGLLMIPARVVQSLAPGCSASGSTAGAPAFCGFPAPSASSPSRRCWPCHGRRPSRCLAFMRRSEPDMKDSRPQSKPDRQRWIALGVLCLGTLMIVIDVTIVNVALPSIRADLGFSETTLTWVVNAYLLIFGGFLLLGGRLGDLYGARRVFIYGLALFTLASLACGLAESQGFLIAARAVQGLGGAVVDAVSLALIVKLFTEPAQRARAMGIYGFVCACGGSIGVVASGLLVNALSWHWVFLVNVPLGAIVIGLCVALLPAGEGARGEKLDLAGALTITAALLLAVYAVIDGNVAGWLSAQTLGLLAAAAVLFAIFVAIEARVAAPLMPLAMFKLRSVAVANLVGVLWCAGMFAWFFIAALYLQLVLGYSALQVGLAFLPSNVLMAACSLGVSAALVNRYGLRGPLAAGLAFGSLGLVLFARAPLDGSYWVDVLPGMLLLGLAGGIAFNPLLMAAMSEVPESDSGLASGLVNTAFMMGGALGLAVLASVAAASTGSALAAGTSEPGALAAGYRLAFAVGAVGTALAAALAMLLKKAPAGAPGAAAAHGVTSAGH